MIQEVRDRPLDVDALFSTRPELFPHEIPSMERRRTIFVGELVKIVTGIREEEQLVSGKWLIVESVSIGDRLQAVGRSWKQAYGEDFTYTFGPENIFRMEPRWFYLWGSSSIPIALGSGDGPDGRTPAHPIDANENDIPECTEIILEFAALGRNAAADYYRNLASQSSNWPTFEDLR
jgi:hypothetical protein